MKLKMFTLKEIDIKSKKLMKELMPKNVKILRNRGKIPLFHDKTKKN